jgi:glycosyltransferase involved in cell wall biosynthesis
MTLKSIAVLIPAYNPHDDFPHLVEQLLKHSFAAIVVVDDGSSACHRGLFERISNHPGVILLSHNVNCGKGAALKTGLRHCSYRLPGLAGVVTADADGQHLVGDVVAVASALAEHSADLIMGVRNLEGDQVPWRSRWGNRLTRHLLRSVAGVRLADTQTGLRGIPATLIDDLLKIPGCGYEFEMDMLLASKSKNIALRQVPISTVYIENNRKSSFNPILDSMKIYFVLFRFSLVSITTALIDYLIFVATLASGGGLLGGQLLARLIAMNYNYFVVKKWVFASPAAHQKTYPKYAAHVIASGFVSYLLIQLFTTSGLLRLAIAKPAAEITLFLINFAIQKIFVFPPPTTDTATEWDRYYENPFKASYFTRSITRRLICRLIRQFAPAPPRLIKIGELGGGGRGGPGC